MNRPTPHDQADFAPAPAETLSSMQTSPKALMPENCRNPHRRINSAATRELCGGISDMSLWRWLQNPDLNFPKPVYIGTRRYWKETELVDWLDAQALDVA